MLLRLFVLSTFGLASSQPGSQPVFQPVFVPAATPTTPPVHVVESLGPTTGKSCLARVGPVCTFTAPTCCTPLQGLSFFIPGLATQVPCYGAMMRYNSTLSAAFTDAQCNATRKLIQFNGGGLCDCVAAPTPAPKLIGSCVSRANGSFFTPCDDFLPAGKTVAGCCPVPQYDGILNPDISINQKDYWSCGFANLTLHNNRSAAWSDDLCERVKQEVEKQAFLVDGCVCPGSDKLNTTPPTQAPAVPTKAPTSRPPTSGASPVATGAAVLALLGFFL